MLYFEYREWQENNSLGTLKKLLDKTYESKNVNKEKIIFYLAPTSFLADSIYPLILRFVCSGKECIIAIPPAKKILNEGQENVRQMIKIIEDIEEKGGKCYCTSDVELYSQEYKVCFFVHEYAGMIPETLRKASRYVVALQTTAMYTHVYLELGKFEENFSKQMREQIDYLVTSEYMADWICGRDKSWDEKILRFGYPKLDSLYYSLKKKKNIPEAWKDKVYGKKVFLFTFPPKQMWLDYFGFRNDIAVIWRPHPSNIASIEWMTKIEKFAEDYNILIDDSLAYYTAFQISDALIARMPTALSINYLYTGKPVCLYDGSENRDRLVLDCSEEEWYRSAYIAKKEGDVIAFMEGVREKHNMLSDANIQHSKNVTTNFDGQVCNRIFDYFEKISR